MTDTPGDAPKKLPLTSMDIAGEKREQLKKCLADTFPEIMAEDAIDFDQLKRVLGEWVEPGRERFGLDWPGKAACMKTIQAPSIATLKPCREESVDWETTQNVFIEGDNLEALKLLQKAYFGAVKMIYIDPPYNTGNEFIYPDKFSENLDTYLLYSGQKDDAGNLFTTNTDRSGRFHSRWLNMMYPRLYLARSLLQDDGVVFISINDNEVGNLKSLCNTIFGEENFIACFVWKSRQNKDNRPEKGVSNDHEYILCYGKSVRGDNRKKEQYSNPDGDRRGAWVSANMVGLATEDRRPNLHFDLINPETGINYGCPDMGWRYDKNTMSRLISEQRILWPSDPNGRPRRKAFFSELSRTYTGTSSVIGNGLFTRSGTREIQSLFGFRAMDFPKPTSLIQKFIEQCADDEDVILDFFAGSCPVAQAVFNYNIANNTKLKFILVQLPEPVSVFSEAYKKGYNSIADIGADRIRRSAKNAIENYPLVGSDLGFRYFKLDRSNFKVWDDDPRNLDDDLILRRLEQHVDHIQPGATAESMLFELLLKAGYPLTEPMERLEIAGKEVFSVREGALLICLEMDLTQDLMTALAELEPSRVICLDAGFQGNDQLKTNAAQTFKTRARNAESAIEFYTV